MKRVYVAGNYSADNVIDVLRNIGIGEKICCQLFHDGFYPFCPWHDKSYVIDNPECDFNVSQFHKHSMSWLEVSDCILVISGKGNGGGVDAEIKRANELKIPVFESYEELTKRRQKKEEYSVCQTCMRYTHRRHMCAGGEIVG